MRRPLGLAVGLLGLHLVGHTVSSKQVNDKSHQRQKRAQLTPYAGYSGLDLTSLYDSCDQNDLLNHVIRDANNTVINCAGAENDGLACSLGCDVFYRLRGANDTHADTGSTFTLDCLKVGGSKNFYMWTFEAGEDGKDFTSCVPDPCPSPQALIRDQDWRFQWLVKDDETMVGRISTWEPRNIRVENAISRLDESDFETHGWTLVLTLKGGLPENLVFSF